MAETVISDRCIRVKQILSLEEISEAGLVDTASVFSDLHIYRGSNESDRHYLLRPIINGENIGKFEVYLVY